MQSLCKRLFSQVCGQCLHFGDLVIHMSDPSRPIIHHQRPRDGINSERARTRDGTFNLFSCALGMVTRKKNHPAIFRRWRVKRTAQKKSLKLDDSSADVAQDVLGMTAAFCNLPGVLQCERWSIPTDPLKYLVLPHLLDPVSTKFDNSVWENHWPSHSQTTLSFWAPSRHPRRKISS